MRNKKVNKILPSIIIIITLIIFSFLVYTIYQKINLNKKNKTYSDSKIVSDAYCVFTVTISLKGADSKEIYAHD